jgi:RNAse (barnase) inhibitor barstar
MKINFPREMREETIHKLAPTLKKANDSYRTQGEASFSDTSVYEADIKRFKKLVSDSLSKLDADWDLSPGTVGNVLPKLYVQATPSERRYLLRIFKRLTGEEKISEKPAA